MSDTPTIPPTTKEATTTTTEEATTTTTASTAAPAAETTATSSSDAIVDVSTPAAASLAVDEDGDPVSTTMPPELLQMLMAHLSGAATSSSSSSNSSSSSAAGAPDLSALLASMGATVVEDDAAESSSNVGPAPVDDAPRENDGKDGLWRNRLPPAAHPETGRNAHKVVCPGCRKSTILLSGAAELVTKPIFLPYPAADSPEKGESYDAHFLVRGKMSFENIGVKQPSSEGVGHRFLTCADCDFGPLGVTYDEDKNKIFYVTHARVMYK